MTAEEKAIELVEQFMEHTVEWDKIKDVALDSEFQAKQCALIAVNEILGYMGADRGAEFWQEVKIEINKL